jgi:hypothetical protein
LFFLDTSIPSGFSELQKRLEIRPIARTSSIILIAEPAAFDQRPQCLTFDKLADDVTRAPST